MNISDEVILDVQVLQVSKEKQENYYFYNLGIEKNEKDVQSIVYIIDVSYFNRYFIVDHNYIYVKVESQEVVVDNGNAMDNVYLIINQDLLVVDEVRYNVDEVGIIVQDVVGNILFNYTFYDNKEDGKVFNQVDNFYFSNYNHNHIKVMEN